MGRGCLDIMSERGVVWAMGWEVGVLKVAPNTNPRLLKAKDWVD